MKEQNMNLVNRNYDLANKLFSEFDRMATSPARQLKPSYSAHSVNGTDLYETADAFVLEMAVPGIKRENIEISLEGRNLDISASYQAANASKDAAAEAKEDTENVVEAVADTVQAEERRYHYRSLRLADINRKVHLPESVQIDAIDAKVEDGILILSMPKAAEAQPRKISVN